MRIDSLATVIYRAVVVNLFNSTRWKNRSEPRIFPITPKHLLIKLKVLYTLVQFNLIQERTSKLFRTVSKLFKLFEFYFAKTKMINSV